MNLTHLSRPPLTPPATDSRPPLLLMLHGVGSHEADLFSLADALDPRFHVLSLRAPNTLGPGSFAWFHVRFTPTGPVINPEHAEASRRALIAFIESASGENQTDPRRVFLFGFSQGAIMSIALALTRPDLLAGVVALSGRTLPELFAPTGPLSGHLAPPEQLRDFPIFVGHGTLDEILPIHYARATQERFMTVGAALMYHEYEVGHWVGEDELREVGEWVKERLLYLRRSSETRSGATAR